MARQLTAAQQEMVLSKRADGALLDGIRNIRHIAFCDQCGGGEKSYDMHHWQGYGNLCSACHEAMLEGKMSQRMQGRAFRPLETTI
jgi:hypothetical protein